MRNRHDSGPTLRLKARVYNDVADGYRDMAIEEALEGMPRREWKVDLKKTRENYEAALGDLHCIQYQTYLKLCEVLQGSNGLMDLLSGGAKSTLPLLKLGVIPHLTLVDCGVTKEQKRAEKVIERLKLNNQTTHERLVISPDGTVINVRDIARSEPEPGYGNVRAIGKKIELPRISDVTLLRTGLALPGNYRGYKTGDYDRISREAIKEFLRRNNRLRDSNDIERLLARTNPVARDDADPRTLTLGNVLKALSGEVPRNLHIVETPFAASTPREGEIEAYINNWVGAHAGWSVSNRTKELPSSFGSRFTTLQFRP